MELRLPKLSKASDNAIITLWHVAEGGAIIKDQDLLEVTTDKATFDVPAPCGGILKQIFARQGEKVKVNEIIAIIEEEKAKHGRIK